MKSMKRLHTHAQHFLASPQLVAELIGHSDIRKDDLVYDLGAGSGIITDALARRCLKVVAVETELQALAKLRQNVGHLQNVTIVEADIMNLPLPEAPYKIFANIPFSLSAQIVRKFTETERRPQSMYLIVQKQFARKLVPGDDHFTSQLGAQFGPWFSARIRRPLRKTDFTPPPGVDTVLLELKQRDEALLSTRESTSYRAFVGRCFAEQKFFMQTPRVQVGISPELRPSQLSLAQWCTLYATIKA